MTDTIYDLLIVGGGPAGLAAAMYGARAKLDLLLLEKDVPGGQAARIKKLNNYPGAHIDSSGAELMEDWVTQALDFGVKIKRDEVTDLQLTEPIKTITTQKGKTYRAQAVIICCGVTPSNLDIPGKQELVGHGVSYCVTCDAPFMRNKEVFLFGSGAHLIEEAEILCRFAKHLHLVIPYAQAEVANNGQFVALQQKYPEQIELLWNYRILELKGIEKLTSVVCQQRQSGEIVEYPADGIFFFVGMQPQTDLLRGKVEMTADGYISTDEQMQTSLPGVYAAGDIREKTLRQVVTAASDGAIAATAADAYLQKLTKD